LLYIQPGKPTQNAYIYRFNRTARDELLELNLFEDIEHAQYLAKKCKAKLVFEVRDIWPLTLTEIGGFSMKHPFILLLQWIEDRAYRYSDRVVSNLKNSVEHMIARGMEAEKLAWIPNGFSRDEFSLVKPLDADVLMKLPGNKFIVGYTGTFGWPMTYIRCLMLPRN
jgi:hypothetical protein